jgi:hypothetical protein
MPQAADDPIEPPEPIEPVVAAADDALAFATLTATVAANRIEIATLRAQLAERDARDAPNWQPLKRAASVVGVPYQRARAWAACAIAAGRSNEARKVGGKVVVNQTALTAYRDLKPPPK